MLARGPAAFRSWVGGTYFVEYHWLRRLSSKLFYVCAEITFVISMCVFARLSDLGPLAFDISLLRRAWLFTGVWSEGSSIPLSLIVCFPWLRGASNNV